MNEKLCILIKISLNFVPKHRIDNNPALVWIMAWRRIGPNMGPIWGRQGPGGPHVDPMNFFAIWERSSQIELFTFLWFCCIENTCMWLSTHEGIIEMATILRTTSLNFILLYENRFVASHISLKSVPKRTINNKSALSCFRQWFWCRTCDKPLRNPWVFYNDMNRQNWWLRRRGKIKLVLYTALMLLWY